MFGGTVAGVWWRIKRVEQLLMPWTEKQHRLFEAIKHGWTPPPGSKIHISREDASRMADEGVKVAAQKKALRKMKSKEE